MTRADRSDDPPSRDVELHRGPTASSWLGRLPDGTLVVAKVPHPEAGRSARQRLAAQARRARAAPAGVLAPTPTRTRACEGFTVWPWMAGRDLGTRLERHGRPDATWAAAIADGIDAAVDALHRGGGVHGALTPDHVLLDNNGRPQLTSLDPQARPTEAARRMDRAGAAAIRSLLTDSGRPPAPSAHAARDLVLAGGSGRRPWSRAPLAVGLAITLAGGAIAQAGRAGGSPCRPVVAAEGEVDVDGDGCADDIEWSSPEGRLTASTRAGVLTWELGRPGDRLLVRDWDCDGSPTPGLFRPETGSTYAFSDWPIGASIRADPVDVAESCEPRPP